MYESPIEMIVKDIQMKQEECIFKAVQECKVSVNREELLKALQYDRGQYEKGYADRDAEIIRCKDCVHWKHRNYDDKHYCDVFDWVNEENDFCSFAERRDDEA